ncbi:MAG: pyridoxal phosphate-dependent decarboxylase family protein [Gemmatimonadales bacterium]
MTRPAPDLSAQDFRALLDRAADIAAAHWARLPEMRAYTRPPIEAVDDIRGEGLPAAGRPWAEILDRILRHVVPYPLGIGQRRWWGFINASPHPVGIAAELIATTLNNNCAGTSQLAVHVELKVIEWIGKLLGLPAGTGGLLVSGGSMANLVGLAAAREAKAPGTRRQGLRAHARPLAVYASTEAHSCIRRAVELLGIGTDGLRLVPVDRELRMDPDALDAMIAGDRRAGLEPICVVATAGTVNTGVVDPLARIADVARAQGLWLHVDGAYGAVGAALPELAPRYRRLERADSVAVDPHKWLYVPYECGATLVRDPAALRAMFAVRPDYLALTEDGYLEGPVWLSDLGPQLSREFRALKAWAVVQAVGADGFRALWRNDIAVAREITRLAAGHPRLEPAAASDLSCFALRFKPRSTASDPFNRRLLDRIHRDGRMFITGTVLDGRFALRGCVTNYRSTLADARVCVETVVELGERLEREPAPGLRRG